MNTLNLALILLIIFASTAFGEIPMVSCSGVVTLVDNAKTFERDKVETYKVGDRVSVLVFGNYNEYRPKLSMVEVSAPDNDYGKIVSVPGADFKADGGFDTTEQGKLGKIRRALSVADKTYQEYDHESCAVVMRVALQSCVSPK